MKTPAAAAVLALAQLFSTAGHASESAYAGLQDRPIKTLSAEDADALLAGRGMGFAMAAELNGYPGPRHVLEHADALSLDDGQQLATEALMQAHLERARALGAELVAAERALDEAFGRRSIDADRLDELVAAAARLRGRLRAEHLRTHLQQTALMSAEQIHRYKELRGYSEQAADAPRSHGHGHH